MYDHLEAWIIAVMQKDTYVFQIGEFNDSPTIADRFVCVLQLDGGPINGEDRTKRGRVWMLGPENDRGAAASIYNDMETLVSATISKALLPCGAANIKAAGEPSGPGFTLENRAWFRVSLDIQF